jgi:uncharacterized protein (DUF2236 family)
MMFGLPMEIITMLMSTVGGAVMRMWGQTSADKADQWKMVLEAGRENEAARQSAREFQNPNANWIRRFLVVSFMAMAGFILLAPLFGQTTTVPVEVTSGFKFLFLDFTNTVTEYIELNGVVTPEWLGHAILAVVGMYFGSSIVKNR